MDPAIIGALCFLALLAVLLTSVPVVFALFAMGIIGFAFIRGMDVMLGTVGITTYTAVHSYGLTVIPLFILIGQVVSESGFGSELLRMAQKWLSRLPGGMASAVVVANAFFAAMSGSGVAATVVFSKLAVPDMKKAGYDTGLACGSVAAAGPLAAMIPPSSVMVLYSMLSEANLGELLIGGVLPGIVITIVFVTIITLRVRMKPTLAPPVVGVSWQERLKSLAAIWPVLIVIMSILGSIYAGVATPTEAAALGALATVLICVGKRSIGVRGLYSSLLGTVLVSGAILAIFVGGSVFGTMIVVSGLPNLFSEFVVGLGLPPRAVVIMFMIMYIVLGCFIEAVTMQVITIPVILPVLLALDINLIWFGILVTCVIELGAITPPFGICLFACKSGLVGTPVEGITVMEISRGILPFILGYLISLTILISFPMIALFLPGMMSR